MRSNRLEVPAAPTTFQTTTTTTTIRRRTKCITPTRKRTKYDRCQLLLKESASRFQCLLNLLTRRLPPQEEEAKESLFPCPGKRLDIPTPSRISLSSRIPPMPRCHPVHRSSRKTSRCTTEYPPQPPPNNDHLTPGRALPNRWLSRW